jgi:hypothetical protein
VQYAGGGGGALYWNNSGYGAANPNYSLGAAGGGNGATNYRSSSPSDVSPANGTSAKANTGSGGGGGTGNQGLGAAGGSGIVIIRYPQNLAPPASTTGNPQILYNNGYQIYIWTSSGSITF